MIGDEKRCMIVAEIGPNHNGNFKQALNLINLAKKSGCDAVKFQYRLADYELIDKKSRSYYFNKPRYKFIKNVQEFSAKQHKKLREHCRKKKLIYICSVFSEKSLELLLKINPDAIKVPSGELNNLWLLDRLAKIKEPVIISSGMSELNEIKKVLNLFKKKQNKILLHCTSEYPTKIEDINLKFINEIENNLKVFSGLSDHSRNLDVLGGAISLGARMIEVHFTKNIRLKGPDHKVSLMPKEMSELTNKRNIILKALGKKNKTLGKHVKKMRNTFTNSIYSKMNLKKGQIVTKKNIIFMKPGNGLSPFEYKKILNKCLKKDIKKNNLILLRDVK